MSRREHIAACLRLVHLRAVLDAALAYATRPRVDAGTRIPDQLRKRV